MSKASLPWTDARTAEDRRTALRSPSMARARITVQGGDVECGIRNISVSGALLVMEDTESIPEIFDLECEGQPAVRCRVAWRSTHRLGVQFDDVPILPAGS